MASFEQISSAITKKSKSNLAFALACLPAEKRRDMISFYAFCRVVDDIADDVILTVEQKEEGLGYWREGLMEGFGGDAGEVEAEVVSLLERHEIAPELLLEIIDGVTMDLEQRRFRDFDALKEYCYRVACVVGLVSAKIFGYRNDGCRDYAVALGYALQVTNIMRDVWQDYDDDERIYLPEADMGVCGYGEEDLRGMVYDDRFVRLMEMQCERAEAFFAEAGRLLPEEDRGSMRAAEAMRHIYGGILQKMKADGFRVFERRYRLNKPRMLWILWAAGAAGRFRRWK